MNKPVILKAEAYKTIILYASRYANSAIPSKDWREIYGILVGYADNDYVYVERAEALTFGHSTDVQLDEKHYGFIAEIDEKLVKEGKGYYVIGWFHSHPGLGLFFSYIDLINQIGFQGKNEDAIGLVFDHTLLGKKKHHDPAENLTDVVKYETGFEVYRITDIMMDINSPEFDENYHKVEYYVEGLNKYFFANLMSEISSLVSAGKPLQEAYRESRLEMDFNRENNENDAYEYEIPSKIDSGFKFLSEIPKAQNVEFSPKEMFLDYETTKMDKDTSELTERAETYIFQGTRAFLKRDTFTGVENYKKGIDIYKSLNRYNRALELIRQLIDQCVKTNHYVLAKEFNEELYDLAEQNRMNYFLGEAYYLKGYLDMKQSDGLSLEENLKNMEKAAIIFTKEEDFAGAGTTFHKIGTVFQNKLNRIDDACLFYREAIENYNQAILKTHPLRKSLWNTEFLIQKINELKDLVEDLLPRLQNRDLSTKIKEDLRKITYNF